MSFRTLAPGTRCWGTLLELGIVVSGSESRNTRSFVGTATWRLLLARTGMKSFGAIRSPAPFLVTLEAFVVAKRRRSWALLDMVSGPVPCPKISFVFLVWVVVVFLVLWMSMWKSSFGLVVPLSFVANLKGVSVLAR